MKGGIDAWNNPVAAGPPDAGIILFSGKETTDEMITVAFVLEAGAGRFYEGVAEIWKDEEEAGLFRDLVDAEQRHARMLINLSKRLLGRELEDTGKSGLEDYMESGMHLSDALNWVRGKGLFETLEYSILIETNSYDLYLKMRERTEGREGEDVFTTLAEEEKRHLRHLTGLMEEREG